MPAWRAQKQAHEVATGQSKASDASAPPSYPATRVWDWTDPTGERFHLDLDEAEAEMRADKKTMHVAHNWMGISAYAAVAYPRGEASSVAVVDMETPSEIMSRLAHWKSHGLSKVRKEMKALVAEEKALKAKKEEESSKEEEKKRKREEDALKAAWLAEEHKANQARQAKEASLHEPRRYVAVPDNQARLDSEQ